MKSQMIITELDDGSFQWLVGGKDNEILGMGYERDRFQAFKTACAISDSKGAEKHERDNKDC